MMDLLAKKVRWRLPRRRTGLACAALACVAVFAPLMNSPVQALVGDLAAITKASNLDSDPQDFQVVRRYAPPATQHRSSSLRRDPAAVGNRSLRKCPAMAPTVPMTSSIVWWPIFRRI